MDCLAASFDSVVAERSATIGDRVDNEQREASIMAMLPLAENYLKSDVFTRVESTRVASVSDPASRIVSEQKFVLRRPLGSLSGTIDKLLVRTASGHDKVDIEIIDFKTDRFPKRELPRPGQAKRKVAGPSLFDAEEGDEAKEEIRAQVVEAAVDYELQMQAYALAVSELIPNVGKLRVTIHFLEPNIEVSLSDQTLSHDVCAMSIDDAMTHLHFFRAGQLSNAHGRALPVL